MLEHLAALGYLQPENDAGGGRGMTDEPESFWRNWNRRPGDIDIEVIASTAAHSNLRALSACELVSLVLQQGNHRGQQRIKRTGRRFLRGA